MSKFNKKFISLLSIALLAVGFGIASKSLQAAPISGWGWGENVGWIDLSGLEIGDEALTGYLWGENVGWISLSCTNDDSCFFEDEGVDYGVERDGNSLSGYAWGENVGWIDFSRATVSGSDLSGYAWGENIGWINFDPEVSSAPRGNKRVRIISSGGYLPQTFTPPTYAPPSEPTAPVAPVAPVFTKDLKTGMTDPEVLLLQQFLNQRGYVLAPAGAGSPGQETSLFGRFTREALVRFQKANNITPAVGYFGPITRALVNNMIINPLTTNQ